QSGKLILEGLNIRLLGFLRAFRSPQTLSEAAMLARQLRELAARRKSRETAVHHPLRFALPAKLGACSADIVPERVFFRLPALDILRVRAIAQPELLQLPDIGGNR